MKKIGLLCLALVLALGAMGIGLAYWTETVTIEGSVATGDLSVAFADVTTTEWMNTPGTPESIDTGSVSYEVTGAGTDSEKLVVTINNAYPGYGVDIGFNVLNDGTIPVDLDEGMVIVSQDAELLLTKADDVIVNDLAVNGTEAGILRVQVDPALTTLENSTLSFVVTIPAEQFNRD